MHWWLTIVLLVATPAIAYESGALEIGVDKDCYLPKEVEDEIWAHRFESIEVQEETPTSIHSVWVGKTFLAGDFRIVEYKNQKTLVIYEIVFIIRVGRGGILEYLWQKKE